jgi:hypothetical protein
MAGVSSLILACGLVAQVDLLAAIVRVESGGNPLALAVNGAVELVRATRDRGDAVAMARWLTAHGYNFDAGLAQVNSANLARLRLDAITVFEPCANLRAAAAILKECRERDAANGRCDLARRERASRDLVQERLEQVVVALVDERHVDGRRLQRARRAQAAEAAADDHYLLPHDRSPIDGVARYDTGLHPSAFRADAWIENRSARHE